MCVSRNRRLCGLWVVGAATYEYYLDFSMSNTSTRADSERYDRGTPSACRLVRISNRRQNTLYTPYADEIENRDNKVKHQ